VTCAVYALTSSFLQVTGLQVSYRGAIFRTKKIVALYLEQLYEAQSRSGFTLLTYSNYSAGHCMQNVQKYFMELCAHLIMASFLGPIFRAL
jgi:hypothetical protein